MKYNSNIEIWQNPFASADSNTMTATPQNVNEGNEVCSSNEKIGSGRGKPSGDTHRNSQSDRQGCLYDSVVFDGKPFGEKSQDTVLVQRATWGRIKRLTP